MAKYTNVNKTHRQVFHTVHCLAHNVAAEFSLRKPSEFHA
jgi:hypothetical protein